MKSSLIASCVEFMLLSLAVDASAADGTTISFERTKLDDKFRSEGVAVGDFNCDGKLDIAAGSVYYAAPDWKMHAITEEPGDFNPNGYSNTFINFAADVNRDGRTDLVVCGWPGKDTRWYENPGKKAKGPWKESLAVVVTNSESPIFADLRGDGKADLICGTSPDPGQPDGPDRRMAFARPGDDPYALWPIHTFSLPACPGSKKYAHGLGCGDINGDGRNDVVVTKGWWEAPEDRMQPQWTFHEADLGEDCAHMIVFDIDGDGDNDIFSSSAHRYGVWWHEQTSDGWTTHEIDTTFSQAHAVCLADINGDGTPDFVTGKRWWAHNGNDPGAKEPAVVYWYELTRTDDGPKWTRHLIDDESGVGTQFEVADVDADGLLDVVTSNKGGVYYLRQVRK
ncbi:MAG: VCBS repeat-containing protein [Thermoguttaceae bacterium]